MKVLESVPLQTASFLLLILGKASAQTIPDAVDAADSAENVITNVTEASMAEDVVPVNSVGNEIGTDSSSFPVPEGMYSSQCNETVDCQPYKNFVCLNTTCLCGSPQIFDVFQQRCVIPLGEECQSTQTGDNGFCPEFGECFMERCVCKKGYKMHTMTRCELEAAVSASEPTSTQQTSQDNQIADCTPTSCEESKGLTCYEDGNCKCRNPNDIFLEEFGRCLNETTLKPLREALNSLDSSEDDLKSFVKLLERFDQDSGDDNSPVHQLVEMLGGDKSAEPSAQSQVTVTNPPTETGANSGGGSKVPPPAPTQEEPSSTAASPQPIPQESVIENKGDTLDTNNPEVVATNAPPLPPPVEPAAAAPTPDQIAQVDPVSAGDIGGGSGDPEQEQPTKYDDSPIRDVGEDEEEEPYQSHTPEENQDDDHYVLPLDKLHPQSQAQEDSPSIVQRQAPQYEKHGEGIPLYGYGVIPEASHRHHHHHHPGYHHHPYHHHPYYDHHHYPYHHGHHHGHYGPHYGHHHHHPIKEEIKEEKKEKKHAVLDIVEIIAKGLKIFKKIVPFIHIVDGILKKEDIIKKTDSFVGDLDGKGSELNKKPYIKGSTTADLDGKASEKEEVVKEGALLGGIVKLIGILLRVKKKFDDHGGILKKLLAN